MAIFKKYCPAHPGYEKAFCTPCKRGDGPSMVSGRVNARSSKVTRESGVSAIVPSGQRAANERRAKRDAQAAAPKPAKGGGKKRGLFYWE